MPDFQTRDEILVEMKANLQILAPGVNLNDDSEWVLSMKVLAGALAGVHADGRATFLDIFPATARLAALQRHQADWGLPDVIGAKWKGTIDLTGANGSTVSVGDRLIAASGEREYELRTGGTVAGGVLTVDVEAVLSGETYNLETGTLLTFVVIPPGLDSTGTIASTTTEGSNDEDETELAARIQLVEQEPPSGGNQRDYERFAFEADSDVLSAAVQRQSRGPGTLDIWITAGTVDIEAAIDASDPVLRLPSAGMRADVLAAVQLVNVMTDDVEVPAPSEVNVDVTVGVLPMPGWVIGGAGSDDVAPLVEALIEKYLYQLLPSSENGPVEVSAAGLEREIDSLIGVALLERKVFDLNPGGATTNLILAWGELAKPNTLTVQEFV